MDQEFNHKRYMDELRDLPVNLPLNKIEKMYTYIQENLDEENKRRKQSRVIWTTVGSLAALVLMVFGLTHGGITLINRQSPFIPEPASIPSQQSQMMITYSPNQITKILDGAKSAGINTPYVVHQGVLNDSLTDIKTEGNVLEMIFPHFRISESSENIFSKNLPPQKKNVQLKIGPTEWGVVSDQTIVYLQLNQTFILIEAPNVLGDDQLKEVIDSFGKFATVYHLNDGKLHLLTDGEQLLPSEVKLQDTRKKVISSAKDKENAWKPFRYLDQLFESQSEGFNSLNDGKSGWESMTDRTYHVGGATIINNNPFLEQADKYINQAKNNISDANVQIDLNRIYVLTHQGIEEHNVMKLLEAHKIIHDLDIWVVGYDVPFDIEPVAWETLQVYFGATNTLKGD